MCTEVSPENPRRSWRRSEEKNKTNQNNKEEKCVLKLIFSGQGPGRPNQYLVFIKAGSFLTS
jgi:hypothetical protein